MLWNPPGDFKSPAKQALGTFASMVGGEGGNLSSDGGFERKRSWKSSPKEGKMCLQPLDTEPELTTEGEPGKLAFHP